MGIATKRGRAPARTAPSSTVAVRSGPSSKGRSSGGAELALATGTLDVGPGLSIDHLLELQRTAGNRAVSAVIQRAPGDDREGPTSVPAVSMGPVGERAGPARSSGPVGAGQEDPAAMLPDPKVIVPVGGGSGPTPAPMPVPAGHGGGVDQAGRGYLKVTPAPVIDARVRAQYRQDPASVVRSPSVDWHEQMWLQMKRPEQPDEAPVAFSAGKLIAVHPRYPGPATGIPSSYSGDDKTGLGTPQAPTQTPLDRLPPRPERPMTRAIAPGFNRGQELATRDTAVAATHKEVLAAIATDPRKVVRSPSAQWHSEGYSLDLGKGDAPRAYRVGDVIIIAPKYPVKGVPTPTYGAETDRRAKGDINVAKGAPGATFDAGVEKVVTQGGTTTKTNRGGTASLGGAGNVASIGGQQTVTETTGDTSKTVKTAGTATIRPDGTFAIGGERTKEKFSGKDDAGNPIKTGATSKFANLNISDKGLGGQLGASQTTGSGAKHSLTAGGTVDNKGNSSGQLGYAFQSKGGTSFTPSVSGGVAVQASDPIPTEGGGFDVTYSVMDSKGMGAGAGKQAGGSGPTVGVQVGGTEGTIESGTRHFDDEKKAKAFRDKAAATIAMEKFLSKPPPTTIEGALQIPIGEERGSGDMSGSNYGASVALEGASLAYGRSSSTTHEFRVKRMSKEVVQVTGSVSGTKGSDVTGGGGITLNRGSSATKGFAMVWEFDLGSKVGRDAFERYAKTGWPPVIGAKIISMTSSGSDEDHDNVSIPLLGTARWTGTTWEVIKTDAKGTHGQFGGEQAHNQDPSWIGRHVLGQDELHSSAQITSNLETAKDGGKQEAAYQAQFKVSGESGEYNRETLGQIFMGVPHEGTAKPSGEWTLTAQVSPDVVRELEKVNKEMREAKTREDKMRVYAALVKERGAKMVGAQVGLGGDATAWSLELKGDKNFPGPAGRAELNQKRGELRDRLRKDPANARTVARETQRFLDELAARRNAVADHKRYTDLPDGLRDEQLKPIDKHISDFEFIRHAASKEAVKLGAGETLDTIKARAAAKDGYKNEQNSAEGADMAKLRDAIALKEGAIHAIDPRIHRAIVAVQQAQGHMANMPSGYSAYALQHRADYSMHWSIGVDINERQMAMAPKADALRMKLLEYLSPTDRKSTADALLAQLTDRLSLLEALRTEVIAAAVALKPITSERGFKDYPTWWGSIKAEAPPWAGGEPD